MIFYKNILKKKMILYKNKKIINVSYIFSSKYKIQDNKKIRLVFYVFLELWYF